MTKNRAASAISPPPRCLSFAGGHMRLETPSNIPEHASARYTGFKGRGHAMTRGTPGLWRFLVIALPLSTATPALAMTAEERGRAFGTGLVILLTWIIGIVFFVRWLKKRKQPRTPGRTETKAARPDEPSKPS